MEPIVLFSFSFSLTTISSSRLFIFVFTILCSLDRFVSILLLALFQSDKPSSDAVVVLIGSPANRAPTYSLLNGVTVFEIFAEESFAAATAAAAVLRR